MIEEKNTTSNTPPRDSLRTHEPPHSLTDHIPNPFPASQFSPKSKHRLGSNRMAIAHRHPAPTYMHSRPADIIALPARSLHCVHTTIATAAAAARKVQRAVASWWLARTRRRAHRSRNAKIHHALCVYCAALRSISVYAGTTRQSIVVMPGLLRQRGRERCIGRGSLGRIARPSREHQRKRISHDESIREPPTRVYLVCSVAPL